MWITYWSPSVDSVEGLIGSLDAGLRKAGKENQAVTWNPLVVARAPAA